MKFIHEKIRTDESEKGDYCQIDTKPIGYVKLDEQPPGQYRQPWTEQINLTTGMIPKVKIDWRNKHIRKAF